MSKDTAKSFSALYPEITALVDKLHALVIEKDWSISVVVYDNEKSDEAYTAMYAEPHIALAMADDILRPVQKALSKAGKKVSYNDLVKMLLDNPRDKKDEQK